MGHFNSIRGPFNYFMFTIGHFQCGNGFKGPFQILGGLIPHPAGLGISLLVAMKVLVPLYHWYFSDMQIKNGWCATGAACTYIEYKYFCYLIKYIKFCLCSKQIITKGTFRSKYKMFTFFFWE